MTPKEYFSFVVDLISFVSPDGKDADQEDIDAFNASIYPDDLFDEKKLEEYHQLVKNKLKDYEQERNELIAQLDQL